MATTKWAMVIICPKFTYLGYDTAMRRSNKDSRSATCENA